MNRRHGKAKRVDGKLPRIYSIWVGMKDRCTNPNSVNWPNYGGRGIKLCERWLKFETFYEDVGDPPSDKHTIDRKNNDGNYEPRNVKWATMTEQASNRRSSNIIMFNGKSLTVTQWARELGIKRITISNRLNLYGWSIKDALTTPVTNGGPVAKKPRAGEPLKVVKEKRQKQREEEEAREAVNLIEYRGDKKTLAAWCEELKLDPIIIRKRLKYGWMTARAFETPPRDWGPGRKRAREPKEPEEQKTPESPD